MQPAREFSGRPMATDLRNPDFVAFARTRAAGVPALIELRVDPRQITPQARLN